jgi:cytochrome c oxidase assembly protein Cox11
MRSSLRCIPSITQRHHNTRIINTLPISSISNSNSNSGTRWSITTSKAMPIYGHSMRSLHTHTRAPHIHTTNTSIWRYTWTHTTTSNIINHLINGHQPQSVNGVSSAPFVYHRSFSATPTPTPTPDTNDKRPSDRDDSKENNDNKSSGSDKRAADINRTAKYVVMIVIGMIGASYLVVPLYRLFCQITGYAGTTKRTTRTAGHGKALEAGIPIEDKLQQLLSFQDKFAYDSDKRRELTIIFTSDVDPSCPWQFYPSQHKMKLRVGDNALAFYTAKNMSDKVHIGSVSYSIMLSCSLRCHYDYLSDVML